MKREWLFNLLFLGVFILAFYLLYRILSPYLATLAWAVILVILFYPFYRLVARVCSHRRNLSAVAMTVIVCLIIIFPAAALMNMLAQEVFDVYWYCDSFIREGKHLALLENLQGSRLGDFLDRYVDLSKLDINNLVLGNLRKLSLYVAGQTSAVIKRFSTVIFHFFLMSVTLFFLFRDGEGVMERIKRLLPFSSEDREHILTRIVEMTYATIYGGIVVALIQGSLGGLGFLVIGLPSPVFWGTVMAFLSFLPVVGAWLVWIPAVVILFTQGAYLKAVILLAWGVVLVSMSDNVVRPILISGRTRVHTLLLLFGILGGLKVFGFVGLIAGPLIITICLAMIDIYTAESPRQRAS
jgi:predicted PurR-regulated permease PerM